MRLSRNRGRCARRCCARPAHRLLRQFHRIDGGKYEQLARRGASAAAGSAAAPAGRRQGRPDLLDLGAEHGQGGRHLERQEPGHPGHGQQAGRRRPRRHQAAHGHQGRQRRARPDAGRVPEDPDARRRPTPSPTSPATVDPSIAEPLPGRRLAVGDPRHRTPSTAIPQDSGPMDVLLPRRTSSRSSASRCRPRGTSTPTSPRKLHAADPKDYLGTFSATDAGWFTGLTQQAGASWWGIDGDAWSVDIDSRRDPEGRVVLGRPRREGRHRQQADVHPRVERRANDGTQVGWVSAVWAPGVLAGNAADTAGQVEDGAAAAVERGDAGHRQLGRLGHRGHHRSRSTPRPRRSSPPG